MIVIKKEGLTLFFRLTASGLLCRTCFAACPTRCVVSDAKGHLAAVITIRHHIYFAHLIVPLLGYCHLSLIRIGYHMYPWHTRKFSEILVDIFGVFYAGKIPHLASFTRHQWGDCQYVAEIPCLGYLTHLGFVNLSEGILTEFVPAYNPTAICDRRLHVSVPLLGYCSLLLIYILSSIWCPMST